MATIDRIAVQISAEIGDLKRDLEAARAELRGFQGSALSAADAANRAFAKMQAELRNIGQATGIAGAAVKGAFVAVAAYGVEQLGRAIAESAKRMVDFADDAKRAGVSIGELRGLANEGQQLGIDTESMQQALKEVNKLIGEAGRGEGELKELFEANNVKLKDRNGQLIGTVEALARVADLVKNAGSEADKLKILQNLGLDEKLVRVLEKGGEAIRRMAADGDTLTSALQEQAAAAARFQAEWTKAWQDFSTTAMPIVTGVFNVLTNIIRLAGKVAPALGQAVLDFEQSQTPTEQWNSRQWRRGLEIKKWTRDNLNDQGVAEMDAATEKDRETARGEAMGRLGLRVTVNGGNGKPTGPRTIIPKKGGGGGGKDETDAEEKQIERFILTLEKEARALKAEAENFFKSNLEKQTAINLAKAGDKATDEQRKKIEEATKAIVEQQEELRKLKMAKEGLNEAFAFGGSMLLDFTNGLIEGQKAGDLFKNSLKRITGALLEMAILGQGPLAKLFGTSGVDGAPGGLIGALLGGFKGGAFSFGGGGGGVLNAVGDVGGMARMAGGGVGSPGQWAMVGENGPELIRFGRSGRVFPTSQTRGMLGGAGGGGANVYVSVAANGDATIKALVASGVAQGLRQYDRGILGRISERQARA